MYTDGGLDAAGIGSGEEYGIVSTNGGSLTVDGGHVFADGTGWGSGIGGGEDSDGATVVIKGGIVEAYAGGDAGNKNGSAIGSEDGDGHRGSLTIDDHMMVHAGQNPNDAQSHLFTYPERTPACYFRPYTRLEPCDHQRSTYTVSGTTANDTHTRNCRYCKDRSTETHIFADGTTCSVCGVSGQVSTISIFLPERNGDSYTDGHYAATPRIEQVVTGTTVSLPMPPVNYLPNGVVFAGWAEGTPTGLGIGSYWKAADETALAPGSPYTVSADVSLTARYTGIVITLADDADNGELLYENNGKKTQLVTLGGRTLHKDGQWTTLCLPFNVTLSGSPLDGDGVDVRTLSGSTVASGVLTLDFTAPGAVTVLEAGVPYLIRWENTGGQLNESDLVFPSVTIHSTKVNVTTDHIDFIGTFSPEMIDQDGEKTKLILDGKKLSFPTDDGFTLNACRAYFQLNNESDIRAFRLNLGDSEPTGVTEFSSSASTLHPSYDFWGRRLNGHPKARGMYIINGRKLIVK